MVDRFANTNHHGRRRTEAKPMRLTMNQLASRPSCIQWTDRFSYLVIEDFAAAPGHGIQSCSFQPCEDISYRKL